jgi:hypothetical protein
MRELAKDIARCHPPARCLHASSISTPHAPHALQARTVASFKQDPYGCEGELLQKRLRRDPFAGGCRGAPVGGARGFWGLGLGIIGAACLGPAADVLRCALLLQWAHRTPRAALICGACCSTAPHSCTQGASHGVPWVWDLIN